jgi:sulfonate transport system substrate-binding protein
MRRSRTNRNVGGASLVLAAVVAVVAISAPSGAATKHKAAPKKINLSGVTLNIGDLAGQTQILLNDSGALKGAQYKVNFATFPAGPPAVAAIQGGSIDLTVTADTPAIFAQAGGVPLKVVAVTQPVAPGASLGLVVPKGSTITSLGALKGTKIAAASGTILQYIAIQALNGSDGGWKNATIVNLNPALALAALTSNSVQSAVLIQPYLAEAVEAGGQVLALGTSYTKGYSYFLAADSALANTKKSAAIADYLHRYAVAQHWAATHAALWSQDYATANSITLPLASAAVNAALASFVKIGPNEYNSITNEAVAFTQAGLLTTPVNTKTLYTTKFNTLVATFPKG